MNSPRHKSGLRAILASLALALGISAAAEDVASPSKRQDGINLGKALLSAKEDAGTIKDPFHSEAFAESISGNSGRNTASGVESPAPRTPTGPRTGHDLLQAIATNMKPSGFFVLSGAPTLVFGQKRVKAGGSLTINFEGSDYPLEIVSIQPPNFTIRLNRDEFTRPIK